MINFLGLELQNPLLVASCPATETVAKVKDCINAGAAAIILKSVASDRLRENGTYCKRRMYYYDGTLYMLSSLRREFLSVDEGCNLLSECKRGSNIPIIGSSAGTLDDSEGWINSLSSLVVAGADALQIDTYYSLSSSLENISIIKKLVEFSIYVQKILNKPVLMKISPEFPVDVIRVALETRPICLSLLDSMPSGIPINTESDSSCFRGVSIHGPCRAAGKALYPMALLYTQSLSSIASSICAGGGIMSSNDAIGLISSGAKCVQVATAVCVYGPRIISEIVNGLNVIKAKHGPLSERNPIRTGPSTTCIPGKIAHCDLHFEKCNIGSRHGPMMCDSGGISCEGCGLCIDLCPLKKAYYLEDI